MNNYNDEDINYEISRLDRYQEEFELFKSMCISDIREMNMIHEGASKEELTSFREEENKGIIERVKTIIKNIWERIKKIINYITGTIYVKFHKYAIKDSNGYIWKNTDRQFKSLSYDYKFDNLIKKDVTLDDCKKSLNSLEALYHNNDNPPRETVHRIIAENFPANLKRNIYEYDASNGTFLVNLDKAFTEYLGAGLYGSKKFTFQEAKKMYDEYITLKEKMETAIDDFATANYGAELKKIVGTIKYDNDKLLRDSDDLVIQYSSFFLHKALGLKHAYEYMCDFILSFEKTYK